MLARRLEPPFTSFGFFSVSFPSGVLKKMRGGGGVLMDTLVPAIHMGGTKIKSSVEDAS